MATGDTGKQVDPRKLAAALRTTPSKGKTPVQAADAVWAKATGKVGTR